MSGVSDKHSLASTSEEVLNPVCYLKINIVSRSDICISKFCVVVPYQRPF